MKSNQVPVNIYKAIGSLAILDWNSSEAAPVRELRRGNSASSSSLLSLGRCPRNRSGGCPSRRRPREYQQQSCAHREKGGSDTTSMARREKGSSGAAAMAGREKGDLGRMRPWSIWRGGEVRRRSRCVGVELGRGGEVHIWLRWSLGAGG
jgi:hypothetical protein